MHSQHLVKNRILRQLSIDELKSVQPWLTLVQLQSNVVLHEQGGPIEQIYFPLSGMISLLAVMQSGEAIETDPLGVMPSWFKFNRAGAGGKASSDAHEAETEGEFEVEEDV